MFDSSEISGLTKAIAKAEIGLRGEILQILAASKEPMCCKDNGIGVKQLAERFGVPERQVRKLISALRDRGQAICGTPQHGYYIASDAEELQETCEFLRSRAMHSLGLESKLRKIPLADLIGQLHLPT